MPVINSIMNLFCKNVFKFVKLYKLNALQDDT